MIQQHRMTNPDFDALMCDPDRNAGPVREAGGTTGEGNLSVGQASRTGGATSGVAADQSLLPKGRKLVPDPD